MIIIPSVFLLTGGMLAIFASEFPKYSFEIFITGIVLAVVSFVIMLFNFFYSWIQFSPRLYLYSEL